MEDITLSHIEKARRTKGKRNVCEWPSKAVEGREKEKVRWGAVEYDGENSPVGILLLAIRYHDKCPSWPLLLCPNALFISEVSWVVYHTSDRAWMCKALFWCWNFSSLWSAWTRGDSQELRCSFIWDAHCWVWGISHPLALSLPTSPGMLTSGCLIICGWYLIQDCPTTFL